MAKYLSVSELNKYIKNIISTDYILNKVYVKGEVSGFKESRGNYYFSLKDENSVISCIIFSSYFKPSFNIKDGMTILVSGKVAVYEKNGSYAIYVNNIENQGLGQYYIKLEALKKKLNDNGMFDAEYKKEIPNYSMNIGVVTAKDGAAIRDIETTLRNRNPYVNIVLYPAKVQGENSAESISRGIDILDNMNLDVIIVGRGGGSIEDLYSFNDEKVAYSIFSAKTPIISAVGHEIDNTISDLVADVRVATPTAAAELATFSYKELIEEFNQYREDILDIINEKINNLNNIIEDYNLKLSLLEPNSKIKNINNKISNYENVLKEKIHNKIYRTLLKFKYYNEAVKNAYPFSKLNNGIAYISNEKNKKIKSIKEININENIYIDLIDGRLTTKVIKKDKRVRM